MRVLIILAIVAVLIAGVAVYSQSKPTTIPSTPRPTATSSPEQIKTFQSKNLKFSLELPNNYSANDEPSRITINSASGQIYVNRNGTQYDNLDSYLNDFDQKTSLQISKEERLTINGLQARDRIFKSTDVTEGQEKIYFIYSENFVYKISTTSESLFDDLDQIAQSFRYTP